MYLLPLFKSLVHKVHSQMTQRKRKRESKRGYICVFVWWNGDPCTVIFKQGFPWQLHAPFVPLSKLRDEVLQLPLILMHAHRDAHTHTHTPNAHNGNDIAIFD